MTCEKCGGTMAGPKYCDGLMWCSHRRGSVGAAGLNFDHLVYTCTTCGYVELGPTKQQRPVAAQDHEATTDNKRGTAIDGRCP